MKAFKRPGVWLGTAAVALAISGSATAASMITGAQIKDGTITAKDLKRGAIGPAQLSSAAKAGMEGPEGATGPAGPAGPAGAPGPAGPSAVGQITYVRSTRVLWNGTYAQGATAICPAGSRAISGGGSSIGDAGLASSETTSNRAGWFVIGGMSYQGNYTAYVEAFAVCAPTGQAVAASSVARVEAQAKAEVARRVKEYTASISCTSARIGGAKKCIARGQFCAIRNQRDYKRYGFTCEKDRAGRYRLS